MGKLQSNQKGFSAVEVIIVIVVVALIGTVGWLVYKNHHKTTPTNIATTSSTKSSSTSSSTKPSTTTSPAIATPILTYAECVQTAGHGTAQISYLSGTTQNSQSSILNVCNNKEGVYVADTTNSQITPIQQSTVTNFSGITDKNLKSAVLSSDAFVASGCESSGSIPDSDVVIGAYLPNAFADVSPTDCAGQGAIGSILLADVSGTWKIINNQYDNSKAISCSVISQYKIPLLFVLIGEGNSDCTTSSGTFQDLVSGVTS